MVPHPAFVALVSALISDGDGRRPQQHHQVSCRWPLKGQNQKSTVLFDRFPAPVERRFGKARKVPEGVDLCGELSVPACSRLGDESPIARELVRHAHKGLSFGIRNSHRIFDHL